MGTAGTVAALRRIPGLEVKELDSGCCGMAGSFGYERGHYDVSVALANRVLLPAVAADPQARLVAPGFSCRSQVHGLAGSRPCTRSSCWPNSLPKRSPPPTARLIRFGRGGKASRDFDTPR